MHRFRACEALSENLSCRGRRDTPVHPLHALSSPRLAPHRMMLLGGALVSGGPNAEGRRRVETRLRPRWPAACYAVRRRRSSSSAPPATSSARAPAIHPVSAAPPCVRNRSRRAFRGAPDRRSPERNPPPRSRSRPKRSTHPKRWWRRQRRSHRRRRWNRRPSRRCRPRLRQPSSSGPSTIVPVRPVSGSASESVASSPLASWRVNS